jgi:hypothetical protein
MPEDFADSVLAGVRALTLKKQFKVESEQRQQALDQQAQQHRDLLEQTKRQFDLARQIQEETHNKNKAELAQNQLKIRAAIDTPEKALALGGELSGLSNRPTEVQGFTPQVQQPTPQVPDLSQFTGIGPAESPGMKAAKMLQYTRSLQDQARQALQPSVTQNAPVSQTVTMPEAAGGGTATLPTPEGQEIAARRAATIKGIELAPVTAAQKEILGIKQAGTAEEGAANRASREAIAAGNQSMRELVAHIAAANKATSENAANNRADRSYDKRNAELSTIAKPLTDLSARFSRLEATIGQSTPTADALIAPELLTVMAGGQGSGLRMNEAEIARIVGGRSKWQSLQAAVNQWKTDPEKANSVTPEQRSQIIALTTEVGNKLRQKQSILNSAYGDLTKTENVYEHRKIVDNARNALQEVDSVGEPAGKGKSSSVSVSVPGGKTYQFPDAASADKFKAEAGIK